jgi:hypothetical protein
MSAREIFHAVILFLLGVSFIYDAKNAANPRKSLKLIIGILCILAAVFDVLNLGLHIF